MGGDSIYKFDKTSEDHLKIFKELTNNYETMVMVQNFLPEIYDGDYRILIIHGKPFPTALARIPQGGSFKGNLAAGGIGEARELSADQIQASKEIGKLLIQEGILFAGIDMIGSSLTEINITSPTGAREILTQTGQNPIREHFRIGSLIGIGKVQVFLIPNRGRRAIRVLMGHQRGGYTETHTKREATSCAAGRRSQAHFENSSGFTTKVKF